MDIRFVLSGPREAAERAGAQGEMTLAIRFESNFRGEPGEGFFFLYPNCLVAVERPTGTNDYQATIHSYGDLSGSAIEDSGYNKKLRCQLNGRKLELGFSWTEKNQIDQLLREVASIGNNQGKSANVISQGTATESLIVLFGAGVMYAAGSDGELPQVQKALIRKIIPAEHLKEVMSYYQSNTFEFWAETCAKKFDRLQKISLLSNILEVLMVDGQFRSIEQNFFRNLPKVLNLEPSVGDMILEIILCRDSIQALFGGRAEERGLLNRVLASSLKH